MRYVVVNKMVALFVLLVVLGITGRPSQSQELSESIATVGAEYARGYLAPLADAVGTDLNAGLVPVSLLGSETNGLNVYFGVKVFGAFVPDDSRRFSISYVDDFPIEYEIGSDVVEIVVPATFTIEEAPSFFGDSDPGEVTVRIQHDTTFSYLGLTLPVSFDSTGTIPGIGGLWSGGVAPMLAPELELGTLLGTSVKVRWVPAFSVENSETISLFGFGLRHSLNTYLPRLPVNLGIQTFWQRAGADDDEGGEVVRVTTFAANVHAGKRFGLFGVYGALQSEQSRSRVSYQYVPPGAGGDADPIPTRFSMTGATKMRVILGLELRAGPFHANTDVSFGRLQAITVGLGLAY